MDSKDSSLAGNRGNGNNPPNPKIPGLYPSTTDDMVPLWVRAMLIAILQRILQLLGSAPNGLQSPISLAEQPGTATTNPVVVNAIPESAAPMAPVAHGSPSTVFQSAEEPRRYYAVFVGREIGVFTEWYAFPLLFFRLRCL